MQTHTQRRGLGRRLLYVGSIAATLLPMYRLAPVFTSTSLGVGLGAYEPTDRGIALRYGDRTSEDMLPLAINPLGEENFVAVGTTAVVALDEGAMISIRSSGQERSPWFLIGVEGPDVEPSTAPGAKAAQGSEVGRADPTRSGHRLLDAHTLSTNAGSLSFVPWEEGAAWADDESRLKQLSAQCAGQGESLRLRRIGGAVRAELGKCSTSWEAYANAPAARIRVAVAGEVAGAVFSVAGADLSRQVHLKPALGLSFLLLGLFQWFAFGNLPAAVIGVLCFVVASWNAPMGALGWIQIGVIALVVLIARRLWSGISWVHGRTGARFAPLAVGSIAVVLVVMVGSGVALDRMFTNQMRAMYTHGTAPSMAGTVLFMGYSTAESVSLPDPSFGTAAYLANACPVSRQQTATWTHIGATFSWLADRLCSDNVPSETRTVIFLGGANDDMSDPKPLMMVMAHYLSMVWLRLASPGSSLGATSFEAAGQRQLAHAQTQADDLLRASACLRSRRARLLYFNDFLVTDMQSGRGNARRGLLRVRGQAVEQGGGRFVDLYEEFGKRAGVPWFNDFIHPSAVGHQQIAQLMCSILTEPAFATP